MGSLRFWGTLRIPFTRVIQSLISKLSVFVWLFVVPIKLRRKESFGFQIDVLTWRVILAWENFATDLSEYCLWHAWETVCIDQVSCQLSYSWLTWLDSLSESGITEVSSELAWVIRGELLLVHWLEHSQRPRRVRTSEKVGSAGAILSEFWF